MRINSLSFIHPALVSKLVVLYVVGAYVLACSKGELKVRCDGTPQNDWDNNRKILPCRLFCINICCNNYAAMVEAQVVIDLPLLLFCTLLLHCSV